MKILYFSYFLVLSWLFFLSTSQALDRMTQNDCQRGIYEACAQINK